MSEAFLSAVANRRTYYSLSPESPIPASRVQAILTALVKDVPSAFNTQSSRAVLFLGEENQKLWKAVEKGHFEVADEAGKEAFRGKLKSYNGGFGTIVFFEDQAVIDSWSAKMPAMAGAFPVWSVHSTGMLQYATWTALEAEGFGANLQHYGQYSPATDPAILEAFGLPKTWKSTAQMPFGTPTGPPGGAHAKTFDDLEKRVLVFGSA